MINTLLYDSFGRAHNYLRISLTDACNLRCAYCMPDENYRITPTIKLMTAEEITGIATIFIKKGINKIRLTGGEPLVRKDAKDIILSMGKLPVELTITTNGFLVNDFIDVFKEANINSVNVGLDTLNVDEFAFITKRNHFKTIINNIHLLLQHKFKVKVNVVVMRDINESAIFDFIALTKEYPLDIRFIEFMPFDGNKWEWNKVVTAEEIVQHIKSAFDINSIIDDANSTSRNYTIKGHKGTFGIISTMTEPFCSTCNRLRLTSDGKLKNCLFSSDETDILSAFRRGEDILPLINDCLIQKKKERAGIFDFDHVKNRAMIAIGG